MEWKKLRLIEEAIDTKKNDFIDFVPMKSIFFYRTYGDCMN